jgi:ABC-type lipoprotein export system ATPase subunit
VDVNLEIQRGEFVTIMGPSGSGKSTLLMLLGGLETPSAGRVLLEGKSLAEFRSLDDYRAFKIGFVFQSFLLLPTLSALENVQVPMFEGSLSPRGRVDRARQLLQTVGLSHRATHLPAQLSVGERQRVAIARSLANDPPILLADEPTGNLDTKSALDILGLFAKLNREHGLTVIVVTHWDPVVSFGTRVIRLLDGRVVSDEPVRSSA